MYINRENNIIVSKGDKITLSILSSAIILLAIPDNPDGVEVSPADGMLYVNTVGPVAGAKILQMVEYMRLAI